MAQILPVELESKIIEYLLETTDCLRDLAVGATVSRRWQSISESLLYREVRIDGVTAAWAFDDLANAVVTREARRSYIQSITLQFPEFKEATSQKSKLIRRGRPRTITSMNSLSALPNLRRLEFHKPPPHHMPNPRRKLLYPLLESVILYGRVDNAFYDALAQLPSIRHFSTDLHDKPLILSKQPIGFGSLRSLSCSAPRLRVFLSIPLAKYQLVSLQIITPFSTGHEAEMIDDILSTETATMSNINVATLSIIVFPAPRFVNRAVDVVGRRFTNLRHLRLLLDFRDIEDPAPWNYRPLFRPQTDLEPISVLESLEVHRLTAPHLPDEATFQTHFFNEERGQELCQELSRICSGLKRLIYPIGLNSGEWVRTGHEWGHNDELPPGVSRYDQPFPKFLWPIRDGSD